MCGGGELCHTACIVRNRTFHNYLSAIDSVQGSWFEKDFVPVREEVILYVRVAKS